MSWLLPILAVSLGAAFYALWARREGLLALESYRRGQLSELSATLGSLQEAVMVVDAQNRVLLANQALRGIFADAEHLVGTRLDAQRHGQALLDYLDIVRLRRPTPRRRIEFRRSERSQTDSSGEGAALRGGERGAQSIWTEVAGTLMPPVGGDVEGQGAWVLVILHDITQQHKLETVRKDFVANVSHELRTPLSVIMGYVETLVDGHREIPEETREQFLLKIQRHTQRLNSLLDDLLSLSRLESEAPEAGGVRERVDLAKLIVGVVEDYRGRPAVSAGHFVLRVDMPSGQAGGGGFGGGLSVLGDALQLTRALENLIDNALKYTPNGSQIVVSARRVWATAFAEGKEATLSGEQEIEVCVRDNGPGIPQEDLPHIFERFYRVDKGRSRAQGGTGLGLSIVKHIVQLHGGRVWAQSPRTPHSASGVVGSGSSAGAALPEEADAQLSSARGGQSSGTAIYFTLPLAERALPS